MIAAKLQAPQSENKIKNLSSNMKQFAGSISFDHQEGETGICFQVSETRTY